MQAFRASLIIAATLGLAACDLSGGSSARSNAPLVADQLPAIADWAKARGCRELASDALIDNEVSQRAHRSLGFRETERVVYFTKDL